MAWLVEWFVSKLKPHLREEFFTKHFISLQPLRQFHSRIAFIANFCTFPSATKFLKIFSKYTLLFIAICIYCSPHAKDYLFAICSLFFHKGCKHWTWLPSAFPTLTFLSSFLLSLYTFPLTGWCSNVFYYRGCKPCTTAILFVCFWTCNELSFDETPKSNMPM